MAIFRPSKNGDAMGSAISGRPTKTQRREWGAMKRNQEESQLLSDDNKVSEASRRFKEIIQRQRKEAGL